GKTAEAGAMAKKWLSEHPKDTMMQLFLTQQDLQRKDLPAARAGYERVLQIDPDNAVALNNLAWVLTEAKDPKGLEYAEHAHRLAPFNPTVLDTLGWALTQNGQAKRGVELLRMASHLAPAQDEIRLHFAKALLETGDKAGARQELTPLSKLDKTSPIRIEADKLLASP
ncbi:MAG: tetratricopeptide repeat protein, partial [Casimicrobiaceae bacterium]